MIVDGGVVTEADDVDDGVGQDESSEEEEENAAGLEEDEMARQEQIQRDRAMRMEPLMKAMTEEQMERYSAFRRSYLDKRFVRRLVTHMTRQTVTPQVTTLVAGVGKVFIGEIVERARQVRSERAPNDTRPLQPEHLIEALRRYRQDREVPGRYANSAPNFNAGLGGNGERRHLF
jgi:transcription initiation factor TFIID subunit 11